MIHAQPDEIGGIWGKWNDMSPNRDAMTPPINAKVSRRYKGMHLDVTICEAYARHMRGMIVRRDT